MQAYRRDRGRGRGAGLQPLPVVGHFMDRPLVHRPASPAKVRRPLADPRTLLTLGSTCAGDRQHHRALRNQCLTGVASGDAHINEPGGFE